MYADIDDFKSKFEAVLEIAVKQFGKDAVKSVVSNVLKEQEIHIKKTRSEIRVEKLHKPIVVPYLKKLMADLTDVQLQYSPIVDVTGFVSAVEKFSYMYRLCLQYENMKNAATISYFNIHVYIGKLLEDHVKEVQNDIMKMPHWNNTKFSNFKRRCKRILKMHREIGPACSLLSIYVTPSDIEDINEEDLSGYIVSVKENVEFIALQEMLILDENSTLPRFKK